MRLIGGKDFYMNTANIPMSELKDRALITAPAPVEVKGCVVELDPWVAELVAKVEEFPANVIVAASPTEAETVVVVDVK